MRQGEGCGAARGCLRPTLEGIGCRSYLQRWIATSGKTRISMRGSSWTSEVIEGEALGGECSEPGNTGVEIEPCPRPPKYVERE